MIFLVLLSCLCLLWGFHIHWKKRRLYKFAWTVPGPIALPFIGCTYKFLGDAAEIAIRFMKVYDDYPEICKMWLGTDLYYFITKPEYIEIVLNSPKALEKSDVYKFTWPAIGLGLLTAPVKTWKRHRKLIAPCLNQKILNEYTETIVEQSNILIEILQNHCDKGEIDHCRYVTNCAMDIVGETVFGLPINAQISNATYSHLIDRLFEIVFVRAFQLAYHPDFIFKRTKDYKDQEEITGKLKKLSRELIEKKKEQLRCQTEEDDENKKKAVLDLLVEKTLKDEFSEEELEDEVNTFLLAGTDTNATSASFVLTVLGMYPDVQQKLYEEIIEVVGPDRQITLEDISKMKYTERVIKETLRVFPGAPFVSRAIEEDVNLGDLIIPEGSNACIGYVHLHRSEKYWDEPLKFDPDRFLPERSINRHPYTWLPFSGGPRNCIGMKYGMMVMKIMIAMVIRKFKVTSSIKSILDIELLANIVLKPKNGFRLAFKLR